MNRILQLAGLLSLTVLSQGAAMAQNEEKQQNTAQSPAAVLPHQVAHAIQ